jgi:hypothetical protein
MVDLALPRPARSRCRAAFLAGAALLGIAGVCAAQDVALPVNVHLPILLKILTFDRHLPAKLEGEFVLGVVYQDRFRSSADAADGAMATLAHLPDAFLDGFPIRTVPIDLDNQPDLATVVAQNHLTALYVAPLRTARLDDIIHVSETAAISTLTGVPQYVEEGLAIGIDNVGNHPSIVVNVAEARREGADLSAQVLKLARVLGR